MVYLSAFLKLHMYLIIFNTYILQYYTSVKEVYKNVKQKLCNDEVKYDFFTFLWSVETVLIFV